MFESLTEKLSKTLRNLRGVGKLNEENISDAYEVRKALLSADVTSKPQENLSMKSIYASDRKF